MQMLGRSLRCGSCVCLHVSKLSYGSSHKLAEKLMRDSNQNGVTGTLDCSHMPNKVPIMCCYSSVYDLIEDKKVNEGSFSHGTLYEFDVSLACQKFSAIMIGSSTPIELYDDKASGSQLLMHDGCEINSINAVHENNFRLNEHTNVLSLDPSEDVVCSTLNNGCASVLLVNSAILQAGKEECTIGDRNESLSNEHDSQTTATISSCSLDNPISYVPNLTSKKHQLLEKSGFHTLRKLLNHFPRAYANRQNIKSRADDGQYVILTGKVLSSRAVKASSSLSFLDLVVGCTVPMDEEHFEPNCGYLDDKRKMTVYVHLKKYFRGARFTFRPFLRSLESKHMKDDLVYISGKVKALPMKDHYEMKEYAIDKLEEASSTQSENFLYPIYPSKRGLRPSIFGALILRVLENLPKTIDPVPSDIRDEFHLISLFDAYMGIHHPRSLDEAYLARRRFLFDDFFYLQLGRLFKMVEAHRTCEEKFTLLKKYRNNDLNSLPVYEWSNLTKRMVKSLPYSLTKSQLKAVSEIICDLRRQVPMNRLLQMVLLNGKESNSRFG